MTVHTQDRQCIDCGDDQANVGRLDDEGFCVSCAEPSPVNWRVTPHAYVAPSVPQWRTCAVCGVGANASVHRVAS